MAKFRVYREHKTLYFLDVEAEDITKAKIKANQINDWKKDKTSKVLVSFPHHIEEIDSTLKTGER